MSELLGTLLPLSAIGSFAAGEKFIAWLVKTHQQVWQLLPLHPTTWRQTSQFSSPYAGFGIGLNPLHASPPENLPEDLEFVDRHREWLEDFGLFLALADHFNSSDWTTWPMSIRRHQPQAIKIWTTKLAIRIQYHQNMQAYLYREYLKLRQQAKEDNILLIGDLPFYLTLHSPLVWANQKAFLMDKDGQLPFVAGVTGSSYFPRQVWNLPLYNYTRRLQVKNLWKTRLRYAAALFDWVRLDSAISFYTFNQIHPAKPDLDQTITGPGDEALRPLLRYCRKLKLRVFVENITGFDLAPLQHLTAKCHVPGIAVYTLNPGKFVLGQFDPKTIYYSSNHDTPTLTEFTKGRKNARQVRDFLLKHCPRLILPLQDWLLTSVRINVPGTVDEHNWHYRVDLSKLKAP